MRQPSLQCFEAKCPGCSESPAHPALPEGFARAGGGCAEAEASGLCCVAGIGIEAGTA